MMKMAKSKFPSGGEAPSAEPYIPKGPLTLPILREAVQGCKGCAIVVRRILNTAVGMLYQARAGPLRRDCHLQCCERQFGAHVGTGCWVLLVLDCSSRTRLLLEDQRHTHRPRPVHGRDARFLGLR